MLARELAQDYPTVGLDTDGWDAARLLADRHLPGLMVLDEAGRPYAVLPGPQVLRFVIPQYVQDDPALAGVYDERHADRLGGKLRGSPVRRLLPRQPMELPVVEHDATAMEIAAVMARMHSPIVAVVDGQRLLGAVTLSRLLDVLLSAS